MAQADYVLDNQSGASFRADLNSTLQAIVSNNSGATAPTTTYAYQTWTDTSTTPPTLKMRNGANNAWISVGTVDANFGLQPLDADLTALAALSTSGIIARTGAGTAAARTITGTAGEVTVTNGDGVSGNPTLSLGANAAKLNAAQAYTAAQRGTVSSLTDGATITADFAVANNFSVTLGGNRVLANPTNLTAGQSGQITITQDATGSRTLSYGSNWKFPGGTAPTLTTTANAVDVLAYYVESATRITARIIGDSK